MRGLPLWRGLKLARAAGPASPSSSDRFATCQGPTRLWRSFSATTPSNSWQPSVQCGAGWTPGSPRLSIAGPAVHPSCARSGLAISPRRLQRRLYQEGTTWRDEIGEDPPGTGHTPSANHPARRRVDRRPGRVQRRPCLTPRRAPLVWHDADRSTPSRNARGRLASVQADRGVGPTASTWCVGSPLWQLRSSQTKQ